MAKKKKSKGSSKKTLPDKAVPERISLAAMETDFFFLINEKELKRSGLLLPKEMNLSIKERSTLGLVDEQKLIQLRLEIIIDAKVTRNENEEMMPVCEIHTSFDFVCQNFDEIIKDDKIDFPYTITFYMIAYSTTRGIMHQKLAGTFLSNFILPVQQFGEPD